jgi:YVTN family beta-propeller protein
VGNISVGSFPWQATYDDLNNRIYVSNFNSQNLSIINASSNTIVGNVTLTANPFEFAVDRSNGFLYVIDEGLMSSEVHVINTTTNTVASSIAISARPERIAYDGANGHLYVGTSQSNNITVINGSTNAVVDSIALPPQNGYGRPTGMLYDPANRDVYVIQGVGQDSNNNPGVYANMTVIDGVHDSVIRTIALPTKTEYSELAYDPSNGIFYVSADRLGPATPYGGSVVVAVSTITNSVVAQIPIRGYFAEGLTFDPLNGYVYVASSDDTYYWSNRSLFVINSSTNIVVGSIEVGVAAVGITFDPATGALYSICSTYKGNISIYSPSVMPSPYLSSVTFSETGLAIGMAWAVSVTSSTGWMAANRSVGFEQGFLVQNGSYTYLVQPVSGYLTQWSGSFVAGVAPQNLTITFSLNHYTVTFEEDGLPSGMRWGVSVGGQSANSSAPAPVAIGEPNGSASYSVHGVPGYHTFWAGFFAVHASDMVVRINFTRTVYVVEFFEVGLANGTSWGVLAADQGEAANSTSITFSEPNGSLSYVVLPVPGYVSRSAGSLTVRGGNAALTVIFSPETYPVVILVFGLPKSTPWSVTIWNATTGFNSTSSSSSSAIIMNVPNGTYSIAVTLPPGYSANLSSPSFTVAGASEEWPTVQATLVPYMTVPPTTNSTPIRSVHLPGKAPGVNWREIGIDLMIGGSVGLLLGVPIFVHLRKTPTRL